jgi:uncharacterized membrane protein
MDDLTRVIVIVVLWFIVIVFCVVVFLGVSLWRMNRMDERTKGHQAERQRSREFYRRRRGW